LLFSEVKVWRSNGKKKYRFEKNVWVNFDSRFFIEQMNFFWEGLNPKGVFEKGGIFQCCSVGVGVFTQIAIERCM